MKDYWRLIGITSENATEAQIRQAHFRTFRYYQGKKNESPKAAQRAVAELVIDYLREAQDNPDLPIPNSLKHLLPDEGHSIEPDSDPDQVSAVSNQPVLPPTPEPAKAPTTVPLTLPIKAQPARAIKFARGEFIVSFPDEDKL